MHWIVLLFAVASFVLIVSSLVNKKEYSFLGHILTILGLIVFVLAFLLNDFSLEEVFGHSSKDLPILLKVSASWSGSGGFIVWWLGIFSVLTLLKFKKVSEKDVKYYNIITVLLVVLAGVNGAFDSMGFVPKNGIGLNPLLKNVWMLLHPPATFVGYALGLVVGVDAVLNKFDRVETTLAWLFITISIVLGSVWSYFTLGWGGYWAWDPVETALLLPWFSLTAAIHSKDKISFNALTGFSVMFSAFVTRGGISYIHGFGTSSMGLLTLFFGFPFLLVFLKRHELRLNHSSPLDLSSFAFFGSYFVCFFGLISQILATFLGTHIYVSAEYYILANTPFLVLLLSIFPVCSRTVSHYKKTLLSVFSVSIILSILTALGLISFSPAPTYVNIVQAFVIPLAFFSFLATLRMKSTVKIVHIAIPLIVISIVVSFPYTYPEYSYKAVKTVKVSVGESLTFDDINFVLKNVSFEQTKGVVYYSGFYRNIELPEELKQVLKFEVNGAELSGEIKVYPTKFLDYLSCIHLCKFSSNFDSYCYSFCRRYYPVLDALVVVSRGLDNYYIVVSESGNFCFGIPKNAFSLAYNSIMDAVDDKAKVEKFIKDVCGTTVSHIETVNKEYIIMFKYIPMINLLWASCLLLIAGETFLIIRYTRSIRRQ